MVCPGHTDLQVGLFLKLYKIPLNGIILVTYLYPVSLKFCRSTEFIIGVNLLWRLPVLWDVCEFVPMVNGSAV